MTDKNLETTAVVGLPTIRDEVLRSQLRPVVALAMAAATLIGILIVAQYVWLRVQAANGLDEIDAGDLQQVLSSATSEQWPVLARWVVVYGLGVTVDAREGVPPGQARLSNGQLVPLSDLLCIVVNGQRIDVNNGRPLGTAPAAWQAAIGQLAGRGTQRLAAHSNSATAQSWPTLLIRLDAQRVAVLSNPAFSLAAGDIAKIALAVSALTGVIVASFVALFLFVFRRHFAARSAERLSAPVERLAATVRIAATERTAPRLVKVEGPAEVAQLAADFNRMQEHLAQTLVERERVIDGQRDLVAALSHELRTPLTVLHGHAELLSREANSVTSAQIMLRQIDDLHRLLSDLLDMARLESIEATLEFNEVPLAAVIDEMIERFGAAAWRQGVLLRPAQQLDRSLVAQADARWLRQIVANLLSNAIRHTPQGGLVTLGIDRHDQQVQLIIEDTGIGLAAAQAQHDPGSRAAGIGLGVVRRLIVAMRGSLLLQPSDVGGTRATVQLLAANASPLHLN